MVFDPPLPKPKALKVLAGGRSPQPLAAWTHSNEEFNPPLCRRAVLAVGRPPIPPPSWTNVDNIELDPPVTVALGDVMEDVDEGGEASER